MEEKNMPLVSVVVPCYNHEKYVTETIESIVNQTYKNIELIVIDDGSKDNSVQVIQELADKYGFIFIHRSNKGLSATLNEGISVANGEYISLVASDDVLNHDKIEISMNIFANIDSSYSMVVGNAKFIDNDSQPLKLIRKGLEFEDVINYYTYGKNKFDIKTDFGSYKSLLTGNYIPAMSCTIKKSYLVKCGLFDEEYALEDWSFWLKLSKISKLYFTNHIFANYRIHTSNSIILINKRLFLDTIKVLTREYEYCKTHHYMEEWDYRYYGLLVSTIKNKNFKRLRYFHYFSLLSFTKFLYRRLSKHD